MNDENRRRIKVIYLDDEVILLEALGEFFKEEGFVPSLVRKFEG